VNRLSLSSYSSADPSSLGSVVRGSSTGRSGHCCDYLLEVIGPSRLAPIRPYVYPLHWSSLPGPQGDDLTNYGALGPFVRSFILLVDPGDTCPPHYPQRRSDFPAYIDLEYRSKLGISQQDYRNISSVSSLLFRNISSSSHTHVVPHGRVY
jgi:hypothetical protein